MRSELAELESETKAIPKRFLEAVPSDMVCPGRCHVDHRSRPARKGERDLGLVDFGEIEKPGPNTNSEIVAGETPRDGTLHGEKRRVFAEEDGPACRLPSGRFC